MIQVIADDCRDGTPSPIDIAAAHAQRGAEQLRSGHLMEAIASLKRSVLSHPGVPSVWHELAVALRALDRPEDALICCDQSIAIDAGSASAWCLRGDLLKQISRIQEARESYDRAIALHPDHVPARNNRATLLRALGRPADALADLDAARRLDPGNSAVHCNLGMIFKDLGRLDEARASYQAAIDANPGNVDAWFNLGALHQAMGDPESAQKNYEQALDRQPDHTQALNNRAMALRDLSRLEPALSCIDAALIRSPSDPMVLNNRGLILRTMNRLEESLDSFTRALRSSPEDIQIRINRANTLKDLKRLDEAIHEYDDVLARAPGNADAQWNKSLALLLTGEFDQGWRLHESRLQVPQLQANYPHMPRPRWQRGESILGKRVLIRAEQGFGDTVQFCRFLPLLDSSGAEVTFQVQGPLRNLMKSLAGRRTLLAREDEVPEVDCWCPLLSLPHVLGTDLDGIPVATPYLQADPQAVQSWAIRLGERTQLRVGIAWSGSEGHKNDHNRSAALSGWHELLHCQVQWHSLLKDVRASDEPALARHPQIHRHEHLLHDFADTAALIQNLDLVISVDTSVAHIAGALGKPVWIMLPYAPDFRWMLDRGDSPWYPGARLLRQRRPGDWSTPLAEAISGLSKLALPVPG